jgi:hypothetical protein
MLTDDFVAQALQVPPSHVRLVWPHVMAALEAEGINGLNTQAGAAATIGVEARDFLPVKERRANQTRQPGLWTLQSRYWDTGFMGRGLIQLTWQKNYEHFGKRLGLDLVASPELLMQPDVSAKVLAAFFKDNGVATACEAANWPKARRLVNGGLTGFELFNSYVGRLLQVAS